MEIRLEILMGSNPSHTHIKTQYRTHHGPRVVQRIPLGPRLEFIIGCRDSERRRKIGRFTKVNSQTQILI